MPTQPAVAWKTSGKGNTIVPNGTFSAGDTAGDFSASASYAGLVKSITISIADFALSASPSTVTVVRGSSSKCSIDVTALNGFNKYVGLTVSGLPGGVVATFHQGCVTKIGTLTFTASPTAVTGPATVTVTGTVQGDVRSIAIPLTVNSH